MAAFGGFEILQLLLRSAGFTSCFTAAATGLFLFKCAPICRYRADQRRTRFSPALSDHLDA
jgi:hypothetical protein